MFQSLDFDYMMLCWGLFLMVWASGWVYNQLHAPPTQKSTFSTPPAMLVVFVIYLICRWLGISLLAPLVSLPAWLTLTGAVLLALATGLTLWARFVLGLMWSGRAETKVGHQLRTGGPYRLSRHPIYTGIIGMTLASFLESGFAPFWLMTILAVLFVFVVRIPSEERLMLETFGAQYEAYMQRVPRLVPGLYWLRNLFAAGRGG